MSVKTYAGPKLRAGLLALTFALGATALAQDPQTWREDTSAPPARFSTSALLGFEVSPHSALRYGIDPETLVLGADGVLRFVLVATSPSGHHNVLFEGVRCQTWETKTYARWDASTGWRTRDEAPWRKWADDGSALPSRRLAQAGMCDGRSPNLPIARILKELREGRSLYQQ